MIARVMAMITSVMAMFVRVMEIREATDCKVEEEVVQTNRWVQPAFSSIILCHTDEAAFKYSVVQVLDAAPCILNILHGDKRKAT